jgi:hypothetical protein
MCLVKVNILPLILKIPQVVILFFGKVGENTFMRFFQVEKKKVKRKIDLNFEMVSFTAILD